MNGRALSLGNVVNDAVENSFNVKSWLKILVLENLKVFNVTFG